jgi:hypothetical protein
MVTAMEAIWGEPMESYPNGTYPGQLSVLSKYVYVIAIALPQNKKNIAATIKQILEHFFIFHSLLYYIFV